MARGRHYAKLSLSNAARLSFSDLCILLFLFLSLCRLCVCVFLCSHWSFVDVPLIFFCPADHVPDWQPRVLLGMVEARSVNVKKTTTTTVSGLPGSLGSQVHRHHKGEPRASHIPLGTSLGRSWLNYSTLQHSLYFQHATISGCGKREARIKWSMVTCKSRTRYWNYLEDYWPCAGALSAVNAIGTQINKWTPPWKSGGIPCVSIIFSLTVENEQAESSRDGRNRLAKLNSQARTGTGKSSFSLFS